MSTGSWTNWYVCKWINSFLNCSFQIWLKKKEEKCNLFFKNIFFLIIDNIYWAFPMPNANIHYLKWSLYWYYCPIYKCGDCGNFLRALGQSASPALFQWSNRSVTPHTNAIFMICSVTLFEIWDMLVTFYKCNILVRLAWSVLDYMFCFFLYHTSNYLIMKGFLYIYGWFHFNENIKVQVDKNRFNFRLIHF